MPKNPSYAPCADFLLSIGFTYDADASTRQIESVEELNLNRGGTYQPQGCYRRGEVTVTCEQNTDTTEAHGMTTTTTYPSVVVVEGPFGRAAAIASDLALIGMLVNEFATGRRA